MVALSHEPRPHAPVGMVMAMGLVGRGGGDGDDGRGGLFLLRQALPEHGQFAPQQRDELLLAPENLARGGEGGEAKNGWKGIDNGVSSEVAST